MSSACVHVLLARAAATALAAPLILAGVGAPAEIVSHAMLPAAGTGVAFDYIGDAQDSGLVRFACQKTIPAVCYGPDQIRAAYDVQRVLNAGVTGAGRTIVIVDGYQSPTIAQDLKLFDHAWGYPDPTLTIIHPDGLTPYDPTSATQLTWSGEISLDVEWAHAIAPGATIDLVLAKTGDDADLLSATRYAIRHNLGDVIAQSFGEAEVCMDRKLLRQQHDLFESAGERGMTLFAASGDLGAAQFTCDGKSLLPGPAAATPASDPLVTGVGGTHLVADGTSGAYQSEVAWPKSGGGFSTLYRRPSFQSPFLADRKARGVPDVAYVGDSVGGVIIAWGSSPLGPGRFFLASGTSVGTPQWAGIAALAVQMGHHRLGNINNRLYRVANSSSYAVAFHDITAGSNTFHGVPGFAAAPRWDPVTGLGTPDVAHLLALLKQPAQESDSQSAESDSQSAESESQTANSDSEARRGE